MFSHEHTHGRRRGARAGVAAAATAIGTTAASLALAPAASAETIPPQELPRYAAIAGFECVPGVATILGESSGRTTAVGAAGEKGIWQIHPVNDPGPDWTNPVANSRKAGEVREELGVDAWTAYNDPEHRDEARAACSDAPDSGVSSDTDSHSSPRESTSASATGAYAIDVRQGYDGSCDKADLYWDSCDRADLDQDGATSVGVDLDGDGDGDYRGISRPEYYPYETADPANRGRWVSPRPL